jgi:hypothetical protein
MLQLVEGRQASSKENSARVLLIKLFTNTVFISEFLAAVSHTSFSLIYPAPG